MKKTLVIKGDEYRVAFSQESIQIKIATIADQLLADYSGREQPPILLLVLTGGTYFTVDLSRKLEEIGLLHHLDTIGLKRYTQDECGGAVELISKPHADLGGRDIIVVEDVVENGATMNFLNDYLKNLSVPPRSVEYCVLGLKENHGPLKFSIKYCCFLMKPAWIVGYGLDSDQAYRGLADIYEKVGPVTG
ncbi:MAG: phosphoribosyltransferase family protein [Patescibacteria group bacterium]